METNSSFTRLGETPTQLQKHATLITRHSDSSLVFRLLPGETKHYYKLSATSVETLTALARGHGTGKFVCTYYSLISISAVFLSQRHDTNRRGRRIKERESGGKNHKGKTEVRLAVLLKAGVPSWWMACRRGDVRVGEGGAVGGDTTFQVAPLLST